MRKLFGTDGIRGRAGVAPLDPETMYRLGHAVTRLVGRDASEAPRLCIGEDTRESSPWIGSALAHGIEAAGGVAVRAGVMPTPGLALVTRRHGHAGGLMVSASHNPFHDNGVKVFDANGAKLPDAVEAKIEALMACAPSVDEGAIATDSSPAENDPRLDASYLEFLVDECGPGRLDGMTVVLDASNGAAAKLGPEAFRAAGAEVTVIGAAPDGRNINDGCGSTHPESLRREVVARGADAGFAFDGDADRCVAVSPAGAILDGDFALYYAGRALEAAGRLPHHAVVATVMSNLGLERALESAGVSMRRVSVGDRYVLKEMLESGIALGGEQSGHVILLEYAPTGDGVLTALTLARLLRGGAGDLDEALASIPKFPQVLKNVAVREKPAVEDHPALRDAVEEARQALEGSGRLVVRYSGTEPLARVMIEGEDPEAVERIANRVVEVFRREVGLEEDA